MDTTDIEAAIETLAEAVTTALASDPDALTFNAGDYRIVVTQGGELLSVTRR